MGDKIFEALIISIFLYSSPVVRSPSHIRLWNPMDCSMPGLPVPYYLSPGVSPSSCPMNWWCHPTISSSVPSSPSAFDLSQHQGFFQWVSPLHQVAKVLKLQLQHQSFQWVFRIDWFNLLAVQRTLKSRLQHHSLKKSILWHSAFFMVQLSYLSVHDYWKDHSLHYTDFIQQSDVLAF